jgi:hypothetical protein
MVAAKALPVCNPAPGIHVAGESGDLYDAKNNIGLQMNLPENYLGIAFSSSENGNGICDWKVRPLMNPKVPENSAGTVQGGQNEAILAARKAIGFYMNENSSRGDTR